MCLYMFKALEDKFNPYPPGVQFASYRMGTSSPGTTDPLARLRVLCLLVLPLSLCFLILALDHPTPSSYFSPLCCSVAQPCPTLRDPMTAACQASLSFTISWSLLKLMSVESVMPSNRLILCCPLLLLPSIFPSIRVFSSELALHMRWPK